MSSKFHVQRGNNHIIEGISIDVQSVMKTHLWHVLQPQFKMAFYKFNLQMQKFSDIQNLPLCPILSPQHCHPFR